MQTNQWEAWGVSLVLVVQNILIRQSWMKVGVNRTGEVTHIRNPGTEGCWLAGQACSLDWGTKKKKKNSGQAHTKEYAMLVNLTEAIWPKIGLNMTETDEPYLSERQTLMVNFTKNQKYYKYYHNAKH